MCIKFGSRRWVQITSKNKQAYAHCSYIATHRLKKRGRFHSLILMLSLVGLYYETFELMDLEGLFCLLRQLQRIFNPGANTLGMKAIRDN